MIRPDCFQGDARQPQVAPCFGVAHAAAQANEAAQSNGHDTLSRNVACGLIRRAQTGPLLRRTLSRPESLVLLTFGATCALLGQEVHDTPRLSPRRRAPAINRVAFWRRARHGPGQQGRWDHRGVSPYPRSPFLDIWGLGED